MSAARVTPSAHDNVAEKGNKAKAKDKAYADAQKIAKLHVFHVGNCINTSTSA